ncbi:MAG TPA: BON domain-containing protein, partial [Trueperaceae bacterium]
GMYAGQRDQDRRYGHPYGGSGQGTRYGYGYDLPRTEEWRQQGPHTGHGPAGYRRPDERIEDEAHERLTRHGSLDASDIRVHVEDGVITLQGTIPDRGSKRMAEDALASIPGVEDIYNELRVRGA